MDVAANTNSSEVILSPWIIDPEKLKAVLKSRTDLEIGNLVLNSAEHPYFDKVLEQAINFPNKEFKIFLYCTEAKYDDVIMQTLKKAIGVLKANGVTNLKFGRFRFDDRHKDIPLASKIDEIKILAIKDICDQNKSVRLLDFDYVPFHSDSKITDIFNKYGVFITTRIHADGTANFSPAIICCTPEKKKLLCPDDGYVLRFGTAGGCVTQQLRLSGILDLPAAPPFVFSLHDLHQGGEALTNYTWAPDLVTKKDRYGNFIEGVSNQNTQKIIDELLHPCRSLQESIDKYKPRVTIDMTAEPATLEQKSVVAGRN